MIKEVLIVTLAITTIISSIGWAINLNRTQALLMYMYDSGYALPDKKKISFFCKRAARHALGIQMEDID